MSFGKIVMLFVVLKQFVQPGFCHFLMNMKPFVCVSVCLCETVGVCSQLHWVWNWLLHVPYKWISVRRTTVLMQQLKKTHTHAHTHIHTQVHTQVHPKMLHQNLIIVEFRPKKTVFIPLFIHGASHSRLSPANRSYALWQKHSPYV